MSPNESRKDDGIGCQADFREELSGSGAELECAMTNQDRTAQSNQLNIIQQASENIVAGQQPLSGLINVAGLKSKNPQRKVIKSKTSELNDGAETHMAASFDQQSKFGCGGQGAEAYVNQNATSDRFDDGNTNSEQQHTQTCKQKLQKDPSVATNISHRQRTVVSLRSQKTLRKAKNASTYNQTQSNMKNLLGSSDSQLQKLPVDREDEQQKDNSDDDCCTKSEEEVQITHQYEMQRENLSSSYALHKSTLVMGSNSHKDHKSGRDELGCLCRQEYDRVFSNADIAASPTLHQSTIVMTAKHHLSKPSRDSPGKRAGKLKKPLGRALLSPNQSGTMATTVLHGSKNQSSSTQVMSPQIIQLNTTSAAEQQVQKAIAAVKDFTEGVFLNPPRRAKTKQTERQNHFASSEEHSMLLLPVSIEDQSKMLKKQKKNKSKQRHRSKKERRMQREIRRQFEQQIRPSTVVTGGDARFNHEAAIRKVRYVPLTTMQIRAYDVSSSSQNLSLIQQRQQNHIVKRIIMSGQHALQRPTRTAQDLKNDQTNTIYDASQLTHGIVSQNAGGSSCAILNKSANTASAGSAQNESNSHTQPNRNISSGLNSQPGRGTVEVHELSESNDEISANDSDGFLKRTSKKINSTLINGEKAPGGQDNQMAYQHRYRNSCNEEENLSLVQQNIFHNQSTDQRYLQPHEHQQQLVDGNQLVDKIELSNQRFSTEQDEHYVSVQSQQVPSVLKEKSIAMQQLQSVTPYGGEPGIATELYSINSERQQFLQQQQLANQALQSHAAVVTTELIVREDVESAASPGQRSPARPHLANNAEALSGTGLGGPQLSKAQHQQIAQMQQLFESQLGAAHIDKNLYYGVAVAHSSAAGGAGQQNNEFTGQDKHGRRSVFQRSFYKDSSDQNKHKLLKDSMEQQPKGDLSDNTESVNQDAAHELMRQQKINLTMSQVHSSDQNAANESNFTSIVQQAIDSSQLDQFANVTSNEAGQTIERANHLHLHKISNDMVASNGSLLSNSATPSALDFSQNHSKIKHNKQASLVRSTKASRMGKQSQSPVNKDLIAVIQQTTSKNSIPSAAFKPFHQHLNSGSLSAKFTMGYDPQTVSMRQQSVLSIPQKTTGLNKPDEVIDPQNCLDLIQTLKEQSAALFRGPIVEVSVINKSHAQMPLPLPDHKSQVEEKQFNTTESCANRNPRTQLARKRANKTNNYYHHFAAFPDAQRVTTKNQNMTVAQSLSELGEEFDHWKKRGSAAKSVEKRLRQNLKISSIHSTKAVEMPEKERARQHASSSFTKLKKQSKRSSYERLLRKANQAASAAKTGSEEASVNKACAALNPVINLRQNSTKRYQQVTAGRDQGSRSGSSTVEQYRSIKIREARRQKYVASAIAEQIKQKTQINVPQLNDSVLLKAGEARAKQHSELAANLLRNLEYQNQTGHVSGSVVTIRSTLGTYQGRRSRDQPLLAQNAQSSNLRDGQKQSRPIAISSLDICKSLTSSLPEALQLRNNVYNSSSAEQLIKPTMKLSSENFLAAEYNNAYNLSSVSKAVDPARRQSLELAKQRTTSQYEQYSTSQESIQYPLNQRLSQVGPKLFDQKSDEIALTQAIPDNWQNNNNNSIVSQKSDSNKILSINISAIANNNSFQASQNQPCTKDRRDSHTFYIDDENYQSQRKLSGFLSNVPQKSSKQPVKVIVSRNQLGSEVASPEDLLSEPMTAMVPISSININYQGNMLDKSGIDGPGTEVAQSATHEKSVIQHQPKHTATISIESIKTSKKSSKKRKLSTITADNSELDRPHNKK